MFSKLRRNIGDIGLLIGIILICMFPYILIGILIFMAYRNLRAEDEAQREKNPPSD